MDIVSCVCQARKKILRVVGLQLSVDLVSQLLVLFLEFAGIFAGFTRHIPARSWAISRKRMRRAINHCSSTARDVGKSLRHELRCLRVSKTWAGRSGRLKKFHILQEKKDYAKHFKGAKDGEFRAASMLRALEANIMLACTVVYLALGYPLNASAHELYTHGSAVSSS